MLLADPCTNHRYHRCLRRVLRGLSLLCGRSWAQHLVFCRRPNLPGLRVADLRFSTRQGICGLANRRKGTLPSIPARITLLQGRNQWCLPATSRDCQSKQVYISKRRDDAQSLPIRLSDSCHSRDSTVVGWSREQLSPQRSGTATTAAMSVSIAIKWDHIVQMCPFEPKM